MKTYTEEQMKEAMMAAANKGKGRGNFDAGIYDDEIDEILKQIQPAETALRFKVTSHNIFYNTSSFASIVEVVEHLKSPQCDTGLDAYFVEDCEDDIEIDADELLQAWDEGERPEDLQMF